MSRVISQGFNFNVEVLKIGTIKPVGKGTFRNDEGEKIEYGDSLQFKTVIEEEIEDEVLGLKETETILNIKIPCEKTAHVKELNNFLREIKKNGQVFSVQTTMPRLNDTGAFNATSKLTALQFIEQNSKKKN